MSSLCWGGPEHGRIFEVPLTANRTIRFAQPTHMSAAKLAEPVDPKVMMSTVIYNRERVGWRGHVYPVLVYAENAEYHMRGLVAMANLMLWLAGGWMHAATEEDTQ